MASVRRICRHSPLPHRKVRYTIFKVARLEKNKPINLTLDPGEIKSREAGNNKTLNGPPPLSGYKIGMHVHGMVMLAGQKKKIISGAVRLGRFFV